MTSIAKPPLDNRAILEPRQSEETKDVKETGDVAVVPPKPPADTRVKALQRFALSLTAFNIVGHLFLGFEQSPITPILAVVTSYAAALLLEWLDSWAYGRKPAYAGGAMAMFTFLLPAHITALACAMLLYGNASVWPYLLAVLIANASKYVIRFRFRGKLKHVLNPSNAGIVAVLLMFPWVGIAPPYHFTNNTTGALDWLIPLGILMAGTMLNAGLTKKIPMIMGWVAGFVAQAVLRWLLLDHSLVGALLPMTGLAFVVYTNYMITDPATSPSKPRNQFVYGLTNAFVYSLLVVSGVVFGFFFALVITCVLRTLVLLYTEHRGASAASAEPVPVSSAAAVKGSP